MEPEFPVTPINETPHGITRRTVMKTAAWAVPVIAVASAAPAFAASGCAQAVLSTDGTWTRTDDYTNGQVATTEPQYFDMWVDSVGIARNKPSGTIRHPGNGQQATVTWTSNPIVGLQNNCEYPVQMWVSTQAGINPSYHPDSSHTVDSCIHFNTNLELQWSDNGTDWTTLQTVSTQSIGGGFLVAPPAPKESHGVCPGNAQGGSQFGKPVSVPVPSIQPLGGSVLFRMVFTLWGNGSSQPLLGNNDDYHVTWSFGDCNCGVHPA